MKLEEVYAIDGETPIVTSIIDTANNKIEITVVTREGLVYEVECPIQHQHQLRMDRGFYEEWLMVSRGYLQAVRDVEKGKRTIKDLESRPQNKRALAAAKKLLDVTS